MKSHRQWLDQRGSLRRNAFRQWMQVPRVDGDKLSEAARTVQSQDLHLRTELAIAAFAGRAVSTAVDALGRYAVAGMETGILGGRSVHASDDFMPGADRAGLSLSPVPVKVGSTDPAALYLDKYRAAGRLGDRYRFDIGRSGSHRGHRAGSFLPGHLAMA